MEDKGRQPQEGTVMSDEQNDTGATDADEFVVIAEDFDEIQIRFMTAALDEEDIPYLCSGDEFATIKFFWGLGAKLAVPARLAERARVLIEEALSGPALPEDAEDERVAAGQEGEPPDDESSGGAAE
jgi:hypothetical protein